MRANSWFGALIAMTSAAAPLVAQSTSVTALVTAQVPAIIHLGLDPDPSNPVLVTLVTNVVGIHASTDVTAPLPEGACISAPTHSKGDTSEPCNDDGVIILWITVTSP